MKVTLNADCFDWRPYRARRDRALAASDRYMIPDFPISDEVRAKVAEYRQALRTMFEGVEKPDDLVFPACPI